MKLRSYKKISDSIIPPFVNVKMLTNRLIHKIFKALPNKLQYVK